MKIVVLILFLIFGIVLISQAAGSKAETDAYVAEMVAVGPYKAGKEGIAVVTLKAKGAYHVNKQYTFRFKLADPAPDGVTYPKPILVRADGVFDTDARTFTFKIPFVAARPGKYKVAGVLSLSVATDANCVVDKASLETEMDVK